MTTEAHNHSLRLRPHLYLTSDAHLYLKLQILNSTHRSKHYESLKQLNIVAQMLNFKLEPLNNSTFVHNNLTVSSHSNTLLDREVIEHRHNYHTSNEDVKVFYRRLSNISSQQISKTYSQTNSSRHISNHCQYFHGQILKFSSSSHESQPSAIFSICEDGTLVSFGFLFFCTFFCFSLTLFPYILFILIFLVLGQFCNIFTFNTSLYSLSPV